MKTVGGKKAVVKMSLLAKEASEEHWVDGMKRWKFRTMRAI